MSIELLFIAQCLKVWLYLERDNRRWIISEIMLESLFVDGHTGGFLCVYVPMVMLLGCRQLEASGQAQNAGQIHDIRHYTYIRR